MFRKIYDFIGLKEGITVDSLLQERAQQNRFFDSPYFGQYLNYLRSESLQASTTLTENIKLKGYSIEEYGKARNSLIYSLMGLCISFIPLKTIILDQRFESTDLLVPTIVVPLEIMRKRLQLSKTSKDLVNVINGLATEALFEYYNSQPKLNANRIESSINKYYGQCVGCKYFSQDSARFMSPKIPACAVRPDLVGTIGLDNKDDQGNQICRDFEPTKNQIS